MTFWRPIETAPQDGTRVLLFVEVAGVPIIRAGHWDGGEMWELQRMASRDEARGWWSNRAIGAQEKLEDIYEPTHWAPMPEPPQKPEWLP